MRRSFVVLLLLLSLLLASCRNDNSTRGLTNQSDGEKISTSDIETLYGLYANGTDGEGTIDVVIPSDEEMKKIVYWTEGGNVFHTNPECSVYARSKEKVVGTLENAVRLGKSNQCSTCKYNSSNNSQGDNLYDNP